MLKEFKNYLEQNLLCSKNETILIAVSGGIDSIVLLHLFINAGYSVALAHCNFNLRGEESDADEIFVREISTKYKIKNHFINFSTTQYASENKLSIEMAARDLRYSWFSDLKKEFGYSKIATGHHLNDSIETLFINLIRGTGINGITGIKPKNGKIIRPLLFASRTQIEEYAKLHQLDYRTDSSNASDIYVRNIIRNQIIPAFKGINPSFEETMKQNLEHFSHASTLFNEQINTVIQAWSELNETDSLKIPIKELLSLNNKNTYLHEALYPYGFSADTITKIIVSATKEPGRIFFSNTHKILIDRDNIIMEKTIDQTDEFLINNKEDFAKLPIRIKASAINIEEFKLKKDNNIASFDASKINFPLKLRKWKTGDVFYPFGMNQRKKLSDFFIDEKVDRFQKEKIWILESNGDIIWVVGSRTDNRYRITLETKKIFELTLQ